MLFNSEAWLRTVAPGVGIHGDTRSGVLWCHPLSSGASAAVTNLSENCSMSKCGWRPKKRSSPQISRVFSRIIVSHHKMVSPKMVTPGTPPSPSNATDLIHSYATNITILILKKNSHRLVNSTDTVVIARNA